MVEEELKKRIVKNLQYCLEKRGISQNELRKVIKAERGYDMSQSYMSKIMNGSFGNIPCMPLVVICEALNVDIQKVFWENLDDDKILEREVEERESKLVFVSKENEFKQYLKKYYCYFYPTISSEAKERILQGELEFKLDSKTKECIAYFKIFTYEESGEEIEKNYTGRLILSKTYNCFYCYLVNEAFGEISFMIIPGFSTNISSVSCRMAAVLTPSAGGTRDATCLRMFMSLKKLSDKGISVIAPHLKMNTAEIYITENKLDELYQKLKVPEKFQHTIACLTDPEMYYVLREEHFHGFSNKNMESYEKNKFITELRNKSSAPNYHKIGKKVDDIIYKYMYKSNNKEEFFIEE